METIDTLRADLAAIDSVLADDLYDSKDWRDSGRLGRIGWLNSIYASRCAESNLWLDRLCEANDAIDRLRAELAVARFEAVGWTHAYCCALLDDGADPRTHDCNVMLDAAKAQLAALGGKGEA